MKYKILDVYDLTFIGEYQDIDAALKAAIEYNQTWDHHPTLILYEDKKMVAVLHRDFGCSEFYWRGRVK